MTVCSPRPVVSLVIPSRNDSYMGNSNWRLAATIDYLAQELARAGRPEAAEVVVVDWGSESPLHEALALTPAGRAVTRFIQVPVAVHEEVRGESPFPDSIALNVGIRRARGEFVCQTGNDVLWPASFIAALLDVLEGRQPLPHRPAETLMVFRRRHLPWELVGRSPSLAELSAFIARFGGDLPVEPLNPFFLVPGGSVILHRSIWAACRGYDESLIHWGANDSNLALRVRLRHPALDMGELYGMDVLHMQHYAFAGERPTRRKRENPVVFGPFAANGPGWGLGERVFAEDPPAATPAISLEGIAPGAPGPADFRKLYRRMILRHTLTRSPWDGLHALVHYLRGRATHPWLIAALKRARVPRRAKRPPLFESRIRGPWDQ